MRSRLIGFFLNSLKNMLHTHGRWAYVGRGPTFPYYGERDANLASTCGAMCLLNHLSISYVLNILIHIIC